MEERRPNILVPPFFMVIKHAIASILALQQLVINEQNVALMMMFFFIMERGSPRNRMVWSYERHRGFMEQTPFRLFI
jgi:hypothetical protein